jgi:hypothetical protein
VARLRKRPRGDAPEFREQQARFALPRSFVKWWDQFCLDGSAPPTMSLRRERRAAPAYRFARALLDLQALDQCDAPAGLLEGFLE